jgi:hypothetical protein
MSEAGSKNSGPTFCPDSHSKAGHELLDPASAKVGAWLILAFLVSNYHFTLFVFLAFGTTYLVV